MTRKSISNQTIKRGVLLDPLACSNVNFDYVSKNVDFVILKAIGKTENTSRGGETFADVYKECHDVHKIKTGVYYELYLKPSELTSSRTIESSVAAIAKNLNSCNLSGRKFEYPIYVGLNESSYFSSSTYYYKTIINSLNKELVMNYKKWLGIYVSRSNLNIVNKQSYSGKDSIRTDYSFWVTDRSLKYNESEYYMNNDHNDKLGMWEYTDIERVIGINSGCNMSFCFEDYPQLIQNNHKNGY